MDPLNSLQGLNATAGTAGVALLLQSTAICVCGLLASALFRRFGVAIQSVILRATLAVLLVAPCLSFTWNPDSFGSLRLTLPQARMNPSPLSAGVPQGLTQLGTRQSDAYANPATAAMNSTTAYRRAPVPASALAQRRNTFTPTEPEHWSALFISSLICIWIAGSGLFLVRIAIAIRSLHRLVRNAEPAGPKTIGLCRQLADQLVVRAPAVLVSKGIDSPCLIGCWSPAILLPRDDADDLILLHELAHLKRRDCAWLLAGRVIVSLLWFQPLIWLLVNKLDRASDDGCDDWVIQHSADRAGYARRLLELSERQQWRRQGLAAAAVGAVRFKSALASRVLRIMDATRSPSTQLSIRAKLALIVATAAAALLASRLKTAAVAQTKPISSVTLPMPAANSQDMIHVHGQVLGPDEKPVAGATLAVGSTPNWNDRMNRVPVARTTSMADGTFEIVFSKSSVSPFTTGGGTPGVDSWKWAQVIASKNGLGMAWRRWDRTDSNGLLVLHMPGDDLPINGRILSTDGQPISGVTVTVASIAPLEDPFRKHPTDEHEAQDESTWLPLAALGASDPIVTDSVGRFHLAGIGRDRRVKMRLTSPAIGYTEIAAVTRDMKPQIRRVDEPDGETLYWTTYGANFDFNATPGQTVQGTIRDGATGQPLSGVPVQSYRFAGDFQGYDPQGLLQSVTDAQGHYRIDGFPEGDGNEIIVVPTDNQPYFMRQASVPNPSDNGPATVDLELHRGVWVTGRVTDKESGRPLPARLMYTTYLNNENTANLPEFSRAHGAGGLDGFQSRYETNSDGVYRLVAAPGKAIVGVWCQLPGYRFGAGFDQIPVYQQKNFIFKLFQPAPMPELYNVARQIEVPAGAQSVSCDLQLDPGAKLHITVVDAEGKPASGKLVARGQGSEKYVGTYFQPVDGCEFDAGAFSPQETRVICVMDNQHHLGRAVLVTPQDVQAQKPIQIRLASLAEFTGRLIDAAGKPVPSLDLDTTTVPTGYSLNVATSDENGRFSIVLPVGVACTASVFSGQYVGSTVADHLDPKAGATTDLGEIKLKPLH